MDACFNLLGGGSTPNSSTKMMKNFERVKEKARTKMMKNFERVKEKARKMMTNVDRPFEISELNMKNFERIKEKAHKILTKR